MLDLNFCYLLLFLSRSLAIIELAKGQPTWAQMLLVLLSTVVKRGKNTQQADKHIVKKNKAFSNFSCMFLNPNIFSNWNSYCCNLSYLRNLQEQVKKAFCYQKLFWPFTVRRNCSSDLKIFANCLQPLISNFFFSITRTFFSHSRSEQNFWDH